MLNMNEKIIPILLAGSLALAGYIIYKEIIRPRPKEIYVPPGTVPIVYEEKPIINLVVHEPKPFQSYSALTRRIDVKFTLINQSDYSALVYVKCKYEIRNMIKQEGEFEEIPVTLPPYKEFTGVFPIRLSPLFIVMGLPFMHASGKVIIEVYSRAKLLLTKAEIPFTIG